MTYKILTTPEMDRLLDGILEYLVNSLCNKQAASHLLNELQTIYSLLEFNPFIYQLSEDNYMKSLNYREVKIPKMNYIIIYKIDSYTVYIVAIFHVLEDVPSKIHIIPQ